MNEPIFQMDPLELVFTIVDAKFNPYNDRDWETSSSGSI